MSDEKREKKIIKLPFEVFKVEGKERRKELRDSVYRIQYCVMVLFVVLVFEEARKEENLGRKEETVGGNGIKSTEGVVSVEKTNSPSEKMCVSAVTVRVRDCAKDMATEALCGRIEEI